MQLNSLCVYCGSSPGLDPAFSAAARSLGQHLAHRGVTVVYGGGRVGLMGELADAALAAGGTVVGVITEALVDKEVAHGSLTELHVVKTMHERKAIMADRADAFVMMPGGYGTMDEFFEALTWNQLGIQRKPCGILNVENFFEPLLALINVMHDQRFVRLEHVEMLVVASGVAELVDGLAAADLSQPDKWLDRSDR